MALIACSECGNEVSEKAGSCPRCGNPIAERLRVQTQHTAISGVIAIVVGFLTVFGLAALMMR